MVDNKPNDWMLLTMDNPNFDLPRFKDVGITPDNTSLQSRDFYKNNNYIRQLFTDPSTNKFDEVKFNNWYNNASASYSLFALNLYEDDIYSDLEFDPMANLRPVGSKVKTPEIRIEKVANPWRQKQNISRLGWISDPEKSDLELASASKVFNWNTKLYEDYTADDMSLFSNPIKFLDSIVNPLVLASWDEDGYHIDPISGKQVWHNKGENKINEDGDFYFETLSGRSATGKKIKSAFDSLTAESSSLNKYDFFDSDDLDKSITGTVFKTAAQIAPLFTPLAPYYGAAMVGKEMLNIFPMVYNSTIGTFTETPAFLNQLVGISTALTSSTSQYAQNNGLSFENLMNIVADVALQQLQQRTIFNWMNKLSGNAKRAKDMEGSMENFFKFLNAVRKGNQTASNAALAYMAMTLGLDTYNEGIELGLSKPEAALTAWGAMIGMYKIDKTGIGEIFFPELDAGQAAARGAAKEVSEVFANAFDTAVTTAPRSKNKLVNLFNTAIKKSERHWSKNGNITGFWDAVKTHSLTFMGKTIGEGLEEVAEEAVSDLAKSTFNLYSYVTGRKNEKGEQLTFDVLSTAPERYGMSLLGGAIGGAVYGAKMIVTGENLSNQTKQELVYLIRNGQTLEVLKQLDDLRDKGKLGNKNIGVKYDTTFDSEGKELKVWLSVENKEDSQNYAVWQATRNYVLALDRAIHQSGFDMSDDDVMEKFKVGNFRLLLLLDNDIISEGFKHEILNEFQLMSTEYADLLTKLTLLTDKQLRQLEKAQKSGINLTSETLSDEEKNELSKLGITEDDRLLIKNIEDTNSKIKELEKKRKEFFSGQYAVELLDRLLVQMDLSVASAFYAPTFELYVKQKTGKDLSEFSQEQLRGLEQAYKEYKDESNKNNIAKLAYEICHNLNVKFAPDINNQKDKLKRIQELNDYLRTSLFDMDKTMGKQIDEEHISHRKYSIIPDESFLIMGENGDMLEHIESINRILEGFIEYNPDDDTWVITQFGKNSGLVLNSDLIILPYDEKEEAENIAKITADKSIDVADKTARIAAIQKYREWLKEHNKNAFSKIKEIIEKVKSFGIIDSETKSVINNIMSTIFTPIIELYFNPQSTYDNWVDYMSDKYDIEGEEFDRFFNVDNLIEQIKKLSAKGNINKIEETLKERLKSSLLVNDRMPIFSIEYLTRKLPEIADEINALNEKDKLTEEELKRLNDLLVVLVFFSLVSNNNKIEEGFDDVNLQIAIRTNDGMNEISTVLKVMEDAPEMSDDTVNKIYDIIYKPLVETLKTSEEYKQLSIVNSEIALTESPLYDFILKLSVSVYGEKLSIFDFFKNQDTLLEAVSEISEYVLTKNALDELDLSIKLLDIIDALLSLSMELKDGDLLFGHNRVVIDFAKEYGLNTEYETLDSDLVILMAQELNIWRSRLLFISDLNDANSINQFKEHSKTEQKTIKLLIDAFKQLGEFEFLKHLTINIDDKLYGLLDGIEDLNLTETEDINLLRTLLDTVLSSIYANFQKIKELSGKTDYDLVHELFQNVTELCPNVIGLETSNLTSKINNITEYDVCNLLLASVSLDKKEFNYLLNEALQSESNIAPLFAQQLNIFVGSAIVRNSDMFNAFLSCLNKPELNGAVNLLDNLIFIDGIGGAGKTKVVAKLIYKIAKRVNPDVKIIRSGPTSKLLENLAEAIPEGENLTVEDLIKRCIGDTTFRELKSELESKYDPKRTYKYLKIVKGKDTSGRDLTVQTINWDAITLQDVDTDLIFLDEVSFVNSVFLDILTKTAVKNNFKLICTGDYYQQFDLPKVGGVSNIDRVHNLCVRTPVLGISLRVQNVQKKDNVPPLISTLKRINSTKIDLNTNKLDLRNIILNYYEDSYGRVYGDKLVKSIDKAALKSIIENSRDIAYVFDNDSSITKQNLELVLSENPSLKDKVTILTKEEVQGSEFDLVIVDLTFDANNSEKVGLLKFMSTFYTMSTRGKTGTIFIDNDLHEFIDPSQFIQLFRTDVTKNTEEVIKNYRDTYFEYLKNSLEGYVPPKYKEPENTSEVENKEPKNKEIDETFEDLVDGKLGEGKLKTSSDETVNPSSEELTISQNLKNIRSYCFYTRIGCPKNDDNRYVRVSDDNSDLNVIMDIEGNSVATDRTITRFKFIRSFISKGYISNPKIYKLLKDDPGFLGFDKDFLDAVTTGEYYIEGRKTNPELDIPENVKNFDLAKFGDISINVIYKFKYKGKEYSFTVSKLADPETWIKFLESKGVSTADAIKYKNFYEEILKKVNKDENVLKVLKKSDLKFITSGRLVKVKNADGKIVEFDGANLASDFPDNLCSEELFIYANVDEGFMDSKLKGRKSISLQCPKWSVAISGRSASGEYEYLMVTPKNMYLLYRIAKEMRAKGEPYNCPIRAVVMKSKGLYIFEGGEFDESGNLIPGTHIDGFFGFSLKELKEKNPKNWKLLLLSKSSANTSAKIVQTLWLDLLDLRKILIWQDSGKDSAAINTMLLNMKSKFRVNFDDEARFHSILDPTTHSEQALVLSKQGVNGYYNILRALFGEIDGFIELPTSLKDLDGNDSSKFINFSIKDLKLASGILRTASKKGLVLEINDGESSEKIELNTDNCNRVIPLIFGQLFRRIIGRRISTDGLTKYELDEENDKNIPDDLLILKDKTGEIVTWKQVKDSEEPFDIKNVAKFVDCDIVVKAIKEVAASGYFSEYDSSPSSVFKSIFNVLIHGSFNPYNPSTRRVTVKNRSEKSIVPFPEGIYFRPIFANKKSDSGRSFNDGEYMFPAVNEYEQYTQDVALEEGLLYLSIDTIINAKDVDVTPEGIIEFNYNTGKLLEGPDGNVYEIINTSIDPTDGALYILQNVKSLIGDNISVNKNDVESNYKEYIPANIFVKGDRIKHNDTGEVYEIMSVNSGVYEIRSIVTNLTTTMTELGLLFNYSKYNSETVFTDDEKQRIALFKLLGINVIDRDLYDRAVAIFNSRLENEDLENLFLRNESDKIIDMIIPTDDSYKLLSQSGEGFDTNQVDSIVLEESDILITFKDGSKRLYNLFGEELLRKELEDFSSTLNDSEKELLEPFTFNTLGIQDCSIEQIDEIIRKKNNNEILSNEEESIRTGVKERISERIAELLDAQVIDGEDNQDEITSLQNLLEKLLKVECHG